jgi:hypothetical protein
MPEALYSLREIPCSYGEPTRLLRPVPADAPPGRADGEVEKGMRK